MAVIQTVVPSFIHVELLPAGVLSHGLGSIRDVIPSLLLITVEILLFLLHLHDHLVVVLLRSFPDLSLLGLGRRLDSDPSWLGSLGSEVGQDQILWEPLSPYPGPNTSTASFSESSC